MIHAHHAHHHNLIAERLAALSVAVASRSRTDRREQYKRAVWTLADHLRCCHRWREPSLGLGTVELTAIHDRLHGAMSLPVQE